MSVFSEDRTFQQPFNWTTTGFMIAFHEAVSVFVGANEFAAQRGEVTARLADLCFPGERFFEPEDAGADNWLVGLYARGKLQLDCYHFHFFKRI